MGIHDRKYMADDGHYRRSPMGIGTKSFTTRYIILCSVLYLANELVQRQLALYMCLNSPDVYDFEIWRVFTAFVMIDGGTPLVYGAITLFILYSLGNSIESMLGTKNYINLLITTSIGIMTVAVLIPKPMYVGYLSGILSGLFLAYGLFLGKQKMTLMLFFLIPLTLSGHMLIAFTVGLLVISGLLGSGFNALPMLGGCFASYVYISQYQKGSYIDFLSWFKKKAKPKQKSVNKPSRKRPAPKNKNQEGFALVEDEEIDDVDSFIEDKIDPILEKIATSGMSSLTSKEKKLLEEAKKKMGK